MYTQELRLAVSELYGVLIVVRLYSHWVGYLGTLHGQRACEEGGPIERPLATVHEVLGMELLHERDSVVKTQHRSVGRQYHADI